MKRKKPFLHKKRSGIDNTKESKLAPQLKTLGVLKQFARIYYAPPLTEEEPRSVLLN